MLIEIKKKTVTEETQQVELKLPAYFKDEIMGYHFAIQSEDSVIRVARHHIANYGKQDLNEAAAGEQCTESEFLAAYCMVFDKVRVKLPSFLEDQI